MGQVSLPLGGVLAKGYQPQEIADQRSPSLPMLRYGFDPQQRLITQAMVVAQGVSGARTLGQFLAQDKAMDHPPHLPYVWVAGYHGGRRQTPWGRHWMLRLLEAGSWFVAVEPSYFPHSPLEAPQPLQNFARDRLTEQRIQAILGNPAVDHRPWVLRRIVCHFYPQGQQPPLAVITNLPPSLASAHQVMQLAQYPCGLEPLVEALEQNLSAPDPALDPHHTPPWDPQFALSLALMAHNLLSTMAGLCASAETQPIPRLQQGPKGALPSSSRLWHWFYHSSLSRLWRRYHLKRTPSAPGDPPSPNPRPQSVRFFSYDDVVQVLHNFGQHSQPLGLDLQDPHCQDSHSQDAYSQDSRLAPGSEVVSPDSLAILVRSTLDHLSVPIPDPPALPALVPNRVPDWLHLRVESNLHALYSIFHWFGGVRLLCPDETLWPLCQLSLAEGFSNSVRYAHQGYPIATPIDVEITLTAHGLEMRIWDYGLPFCPWDTLGRRGLGLGWFQSPLAAVAPRLLRLGTLATQPLDWLVSRGEALLAKWLALPVGGRGLPLMHEVADYLDYIPMTQGRNCLLMIKYFDPLPDSLPMVSHKRPQSTN